MINPGQLQDPAKEAAPKSFQEASEYKYALEEFSIVTITDQEGIIRYANDIFAKFQKYTREELFRQKSLYLNLNCNSQV